MSDSEIIVQALQIVVPIVAAAASIIGVYKTINARSTSEERESVKQETAFGIKLDTIEGLLSDVKKSQDKLLDGYHSNEKRITKIEDHLEAHSKEIDSMKIRLDRLEERC